MNNKPIGVFDSGLGGLTVVRELLKILPDENIVYFGDTGRVPYGTRSRETIVRYARQDMNFLLTEEVKHIVIACGTVSSVASDAANALPVPYTGVVKPAAEAAAKTTKNGNIGIIGTTATIGSNSFSKAISAVNPSLKVLAVDCPLFVPLVENGFIDDDEVSYLVAKRYLDVFAYENIDTLILGCTHYPLLKRVILKVLGSSVTLIDTGFETAGAVKRSLLESNMLNTSGQTGECRFFVSDRTDDFSRVASMFLNRNISADVSLVDIEKYGY